MVLNVFCCFVVILFYRLAALYRHALSRAVLSTNYLHARRLPGFRIDELYVRRMEGHCTLDDLALTIPCTWPSMPFGEINAIKNDEVLLREHAYDGTALSAALPCDDYDFISLL